MSHRLNQMPNTVELGLYALKDLPNGEYVKLKPDGKKVYQKIGWDRSTRKYELMDCDDVNRVVFRKADTQVQAGFTY